MGNDFYTASGLLNVFSLNTVLIVKALLGAFYQEKALVEGLLHDYEIFANLRSKLYHQNCCLGFCVEIL